MKGDLVVSCVSDKNQFDIYLTSSLMSCEYIERTQIYYNKRENKMFSTKPFELSHTSWLNGVDV